MDFLYLRFYDKVVVYVLVNFSDIKVNLILDKELNAIFEKVGPLHIEAHLFECGQI